MEFEKSVECKRGATTNYRITVTPTRITIKSPSNRPDGEVDFMEKALAEAADALYDVTASYRGTIKSSHVSYGWIRLKDNGRKNVRWIRYIFPKELIEKNPQAYEIRKA